MLQFLIHEFGQVITVQPHVRKNKVSVLDCRRLGFLLRTILQIGEVASDDAPTALNADAPSLKIRVLVCVACKVSVFHGGVSWLTQYTPSELQ